MPAAEARLQRRVWLIAGFDPRSPRHVHRLLRRAAAARPADGSQARVQPLDASGAAWTMRWTDAHGERQTLCQVLAWDDLARRLWPRGLRGLLAAAGRVYGRAFTDGRCMRRLWRDARPGLAMGLTPLALALAAGLLGTLAGLVALGVGAPGWAALGLGLVLTAGLAAWASRRGRSAWMLGLLDLSERLGRGDAVLADRCEAMAAALVAAASQDDADELLLVAHSIGSTWAVAVLAQALRLAPWLGTRGPRLRLVTLGQTLPLSTLRRSADALRADVALLAATPQLVWQDWTAPSDWAAFYRLPPWFTAPPPAARVQARSPRFHAWLTPAHYAALKRDRHALHMQYLHAHDLPGGCDIVALTAGPARLADLP